MEERDEKEINDDGDLGKRERDHEEKRDHEECKRVSGGYLGIRISTGMGTNYSNSVSIQVKVHKGLHKKESQTTKKKEGT
jgi:hypothetical protein